MLNSETNYNNMNSYQENKYQGAFEHDPYTLYGYRRIPYECNSCKMQFHKKLEFDNHKKNFCVNSLYNNKDYLDYVSLREKIKNDCKIRSTPTIRQLIGIDKTQNELDKLDELLQKNETDDIEQKEKRDLEEIDKLIGKWKSQKSVQGIRSSNIEQRIEQLINLQDNERERRDRYLSDMDMFRGKLNDLKVATTKDVVRKRALEDVVIKRDELFEKENDLIKQCSTQKNLYLKIKDYEFQGKSAPSDLYSNFQEIMTNCEYLDELVETKRNYIYNNFETASQDAFLKFFTENGKKTIYDVDTLKDVIQRTSTKIDKQRGNLRDVPRQFIDDNWINDLTRIKRDDKYHSMDDVVLRTTQKAGNYQEQSTILRNVRKNIESYGQEMGLKNTNSQIVPRNIYERNK